MGSVAMLSLMARFGDVSNAFTRWMSGHSFGLYVFHYLMIALSAYYLRKYCPFLAPFVVYLIVAIAGFFGAYLLNEIISRIPVISDESV